MDDRDRNKWTDAAAECRIKRGYQSPVLTEYGSVEELVDAGVVGGTVPSLTPPTL